MDSNWEKRWAGQRPNTKHHRAIFVKGRQAAREGLSHEDCPYQKTGINSSVAFKWWVLGFRDESIKKTEVK